MRKKREWRKACAWLLCGALLSTALPQAGWTAEGEPGSEDDVIYYESWDSEEERWKTESLKTGSYEILQEGDADWNDDDGGWYVVPATDETIKTLDRINIEGDVHLILLNNSSFECQNGIQVSEGSSLSIYAQEITSEELPGQLNAKIVTTNAEYAGIGGSKSEPNVGTINIYGGKIDSVGNRNSAGIGGSYQGTTGEINLYGGVINATGGRNGAGIGGGEGISQVNSICISERADVTVTGGVGGGAAIGGGRSGNFEKIEILGGTIKAEGTDGGAGIGSGSGNRNKGTISITGGTVTAIGGDNNSGNAGAGIGGSGSRNSGFAGGTINISGGHVVATGGNGSKNNGDGIGNGGGFKSTSSDPSRFLTGENGKAIIFAFCGDGANAIYDTSGKEESVETAWNGIIFENNTGQVYGDITLDQSFEVPADHTLMIAAGNTLTVPDGLTLTNNGTIDGYGTLIGTVTGKAPASTIDRGKVTITVTASTGGSASGGGEYDKDEEVSLKATAEPHYQFTGWYDGESKVSADVIYTFEAESDRTLTAKFEKTDHTFSDWQSDGDGTHFRTCTIEDCDAAEQEACSGGNATCTDKAVCTVCNTAYGEINPENHAEKAAWTTTATSHSKVYPCCKAVAEPEAAHQWQDGTCIVCAYKCNHALQFVERVEATTSQTGMEAHYACDYCGLLFRDEAGAEPVSAEDLVIPEKETPSVTPSKPGVNVAASAHGSVSLSTKAPAYRETVTITPAPEAGYEVASVQVTDARGRQIAVTAQDDGTYTYTQPSGTVTITVTFAEKAEEPQPAPVTEIFADLVPGAWYEDAVQYAYDNGLLTGTSATTFAPDAATTRGMAVSVLHRLAGSPAAEEDAAFDDVDASAWYGEAVRWAVSEGIVNGYSDTAFGPDDAVTREQLAAMLQSFSTWRGDADGTRSDLSGYEDASAVSGWALDAVEWANAQGLLNGTSATTLAPQGQATRAQVAAMLQRFLSA